MFWTDFSQNDVRMLKRCPFSRLMNLAVSQFLNHFFFSSFNYFELIRHNTDFGVPLTNMRVLFRVGILQHGNNTGHLVFEPGLKKKDLFRRNSNSLSHTFLSFRLWNSSKSIGISDICFGRESFGDSRLQTLYGKKKRSPTGISSVVLKHWIFFRWLLSRSAFRWKYSAVTKNTSDISSTFLSKRCAHSVHRQSLHADIGLSFMSEQCGVCFRNRGR